MYETYLTDVLKVRSVEVVSLFRKRRIIEASIILTEINSEREG
jgi:hypothetical protein